MLGHVQAHGLLALRDAQRAANQLDDLRDDERHHTRKHDDEQHRLKLRHDLHRVAVQQACQVAVVGGICEDASQHRAAHAADAMHAERVERVVVAEVLLELGHREVADDTHDRAHDDRRPHIDVARAGRNGHEARNRTGARAEQRHLARAQALDEHPCQHRRGRRRVRRRERQASLAVGSERRTRVEAEPAEPQEQRAQQHERDVVRLIRQLAVALAGPDDESEHKRRDARRDVHDIATSKVVRAERRRDPAAAPHHVSQRRVHEQQPARDEDEKAAEAHALDDAAGDDGDRDEREHALEQREHELGDRAPRRVDRDAREEQAIEAAQDRVGNRLARSISRREAATKRQGVAHGHPQHADEARDARAHEHRVAYVLASNHSSVGEGNAERHDEHQKRADDNKRGVAGTDFGHALSPRLFVASCTLWAQDRPSLTYRDEG